LTFGWWTVPRNRPIPFGRGTRLCREPAEARQLRPRDSLRAQIRHSSVDRLEVLDASLHLYWVRIPFISTSRTPFLILYPHSVLIPVYAFSLFLPTIINDLGYQAAQAQLLSTPPYIAGCICTVIIGIISDKYKSRGPFVCLSTTVGIIGYSILYGTSLKQPRGAQVFFPFLPLYRLIPLGCDVPPLHRFRTVALLSLPAVCSPLSPSYLLGQVGPQAAILSAAWHSR